MGTVRKLGNGSSGAGAQTTQVWRRAEAMDKGWTDSRLRRAVGGGQLERVFRGHYASPGDYGRREFHRGISRAVIADAVLRWPGRVALSHNSAAAFHGIWAPLTEDPRVHLSVARPSGGKVSRHRHVHVAPDVMDSVEMHDGIPVTDAARTVSDLMHSLPPDQSVIVLDQALHRRLVGEATLQKMVFRPGRRRGVIAAREAWELRDGRSRSVLETLSRLRLLGVRVALPEPELYPRVELGPLTVDPWCVWRRQKVIVELRPAIAERWGGGVIAS